MLATLCDTFCKYCEQALATLTPWRPEAFAVKTRMQKPPGELAVSKSVKYDNLSFSALKLLVGQQEGHLPRKKAECWFVDSDDLIGAL